ncbi:MAG: hypothetical protein QNJ90_04900 [Planctomycetota bacterium]|nr:hypothetical protein [Planctomycetota bacterium]
MKTLIAITGSVLSLALAVPAFGAEATSPHHNRAEKYLRAGTQVLARAAKVDDTSSRLSLAKRALTSLHRAKAIQHVHLNGTAGDLKASIETALIRALNVKARAYLDRGALKRAKLVNQAALAFTTPNMAALKLRSDIAKAEATDLYEAVNGRVGIDRVRERRSQAGAPVRERGLSRRR